MTMTLAGTSRGLERLDESLDAVAVQYVGQRIERRQLPILFFFALPFQIMDLPALLAMLATQPQPLRYSVGGGEDHPQAQDPQVPIFRADPISHEFDLVDLDVVVGFGEIAAKIDGKYGGIAEIGLRLGSRQVVLGYPPLRHPEFAQADGDGLRQIPRRDVDEVVLRRIQILESRESRIESADGDAQVPRLARISNAPGSKSGSAKDRCPDRLSRNAVDSRSCIPGRPPPWETGRQSGNVTGLPTGCPLAPHRRIASGRRWRGLSCYRASAGVPAESDARPRRGSQQDADQQRSRVTGFPGTRFVHFARLADSVVLLW